MKLDCGHEFEGNVKRCPVCRPGRRKESKEELLAMQLLNEGIEGWERQHQFKESRKYSFDFAWPGLRLAVEIEGGTWVAGRHTRGKGYEEDCRKYNLAALEGWTVLRFTSDMVKRNEAIRLIRLVIDGRMDASSTKHR